MFSIFIFIATFIVLLRMKYKQKGSYTPSLFLISLYVLSSICAILDVYYSGDSAIMSMQYAPVALLFVCILMLFIYPYSSIKEENIKSIVLPRKQIVDVFSNVVILLSLGAIFFFFSGVLNVFSYGSLSDARNDRYEHNVSFIESGPVYTIFSVAASLYVFALLFFFIYTVLGGHRKKRLLLLISSFSESLHVLTEVGRDGIVFWIFNFIFFYLLFKDYIHESTLKKLKKYILIFGIIMMVPFMLISMSRFSENVTGGLVSYMGQSFKHFCYYMDMPNKTLEGGANFPLYFEIIGEKKPPFVVWGNNLTDSSSFGTFIRSFIQDFGVIWTIIIGLLISLFIKGALRIRNGTFNFSQLFIFILLFQIYSQGLFYFRQYTRGGNLFILLSIALWLFFQRRQSDSNQKIIINKL